MNSNRLIEVFQNLEQTPALVFNQTAIQGRIEALRELQQQFNCRFLMSVKAFPDDGVVKWFANSGIGYDVSNLGEVRKVCAVARTSSANQLYLSIAGPVLAQQVDELSQLLHEYAGCFGRVICNVSSEKELALVQSKTGDSVRLGIRLRATLPEHDTSGWFEKRSRFGLEGSGEILSSVGSLCHGFHVHHGAETNSADTFRDAASRLIETASRYCIKLDFINLGGGLLGWSAQEVSSLLTELRSIVPHTVELMLEPGAFWFDGAGYAVCRVIQNDRFFNGVQRIVVDLSSESHLKWSSVRLCLPEVNQEQDGHPWTLVVYGASCYEKDLIGVYRIHGPVETYDPGDAVFFAGVNSYSVAWNTEFNGLPKAQVSFFADDEFATAANWREIDSTGAYGKVWIDFCTSRSAPDNFDKGRGGS